MKKTVILNFLFITSGLIYAMEPTKQTKTEELFHLWEQLPAEIKAHILSFVPQIGSYEEFKKLQSVNKQFQSLTNELGILTAFFKKLMETRPDEARDFFITAIINDDPNSFKIVTAFLRAGMDPNVKNKNGDPALLLATQFNHNEIAKLLIDNKADVNMKSDDQEFPLLQAISNNNKVLVDLYLKAGANVDEKDAAGTTPLLEAAGESGYKSIFDMILAKNPETQVKDNMGYNILHYASRYNSTETARYIISKNLVDINSTTNDGVTALMLAATKGDVKIVDLLLKNKANVNLADTKGDTALHYAAICECGSECDCAPGACKSQNSCIEVAKLLIKSGANMQTEDNEGYTPEALAETYDKPQLVTYFMSVRTGQTE